MSQVFTLVLSEARLAGGDLVDIGIAGETIASIAPAGSAQAGTAETFACKGRLVTPSFVEGHIHLDKTLLGLPFIPHRPGHSVAARIEAERALRRDLTMPVVERGGRLIEQVARFGTGALRSHVDIDGQSKLDGLQAVLELKRRYAHLVDIEIVAFPLTYA